MKKYLLYFIGAMLLAIFSLMYSTDKENVKKDFLESAVNKYLSDKNIIVASKEFNPIKTRYYNSSGEIMKASKVWEGIVVPSSSTQTIDISSAGFTNIRKINITGANNTTTLTSMPFAIIKSYTNTSITVSILASNNQIVALLNTSVSGLVLATGLTGMELHVEVNGD